MTQYPCVKCWGVPCHCAGDFVTSPSLIQLEQMSTLQLELLRDSINRLLGSRKQTVVYSISSHLPSPIMAPGRGLAEVLNTTVDKGLTHE